MQGTRIAAAILLVAGILVGLFVYRSEANDVSRFPFKLGLDLAGGALLTYEADISGVEAGEIEGSMNALRDVIERRVNLFGVGEPRVSVETATLSGTEKHRLIVELPGVTDVDEAIRRLGETPVLEFKLVSPEAYTAELADFENADLDDFYIDTGLTGRYLNSARMQFGGAGAGGAINEAFVAIEFDNTGAELFEKITRENLGEVLAIFLDGQPISQPVIQAVIESGQAVITGSFTPEEARDLARDLNFGALPLPVELVSTQTVGGTLGSDTVAAGVAAAMWGLGLVALFMIIWYRLPGLVAVVALAIYVIVMLALFKLLGITLTAAGIAGFILSIGMAVDANILIFERMKEELAHEGRSVADAVREGFKRAWLSIRDGNLTSIFTAIILFYTTTSLVKGFALTFGLGVLISMITAIGVTRTFLLSLASEKEGSSTNSPLFTVGFSKKA